MEGSAGYELVSLKGSQSKSDNRKEWVGIVRSTLKNKWTGGLSVIDKDINEHYNSGHYAMRLERDFMINGEDFQNLFSGVYIASKRDKHDYYSNYYLLDIPESQKKAIYLQFDIGK